MPHLYRHKGTNLLYTLEHIIIDLYHTNRGGLTGIKAYPYNHLGQVLTHLRDSEKNFNPPKYVLDNFTIVAEL